MSDTYVEIAQKMARAENAVAFTGAGISTESGIPDYRSKGGIWKKFQPVYFDDFMSSRDARVEYWRRKAELYPELAAAKPNAAHRALADLHAMGRLSAVITQNVDGLHQEAGIPDDAVIEIHGNTRRVRCMTCDRLYALDEVHKRWEGGDTAPECSCGGFLKPDTISFGQSMPERALQRSVTLSEGADVFVVVGSTLLVQPAASLPGYALRNGAWLAIVNLSETPYDSHAHALVNESAGRALPAVAEKVREIVGGE
ncbi:MAG: SIR2 family NAD-dependent protein deacylase [Desulfatibacillaceae bacterium]